MKDYGYWEFDTKERLLNITYMAMLAEDIGKTLSHLHKDKAHEHEWVIEEAECADPSQRAWVAVCLHCDATADPDEVDGGDHD